MGKRKGRLSAGSVLMLALTVLVLLGSALVLLRLKSGTVRPVVRTDVEALTGIGGREAEPEAESAEAPRTEQSAPPGQAAAREPAAQPTAGTAARATLTAAGTLALEKNLRQSCYAADTKVYDFTEPLALLKPEIQGSLNTVFFENLLMEDTKVTETVVPAGAAEMLRQAGFQLSLSGFPKAWEKQAEGIRQTVDALRERGITALGLQPEGAAERYVTREANGIRIAMAQYAADVTAATRKSMSKKNAESAIPEADPERIREDITAARAAGADIAVVFVHWGKTGAKSPDKNQTVLAQQIADAGADLIIGAGSRVAQPVERLTAADGRQVVCAWSLGTLMSDDRSSASRIGGFLLHVTFKKEAQGAAYIAELTYTPTYVWKYRQDSTYYYKCLAADQAAPDGMDDEQRRLMEKTCEAVKKVLEGTGVAPR